MLHRELDIKTGKHHHQLRAAIAEATPGLTPCEVRKAHALKKASDMARHAKFDQKGDRILRGGSTVPCGICWCGAWVWTHMWAEEPPSPSEVAEPQPGDAEGRFAEAVKAAEERDEAARLWWTTGAELRFATGVLQQAVREDREREAAAAEVVKPQTRPAGPEGEKLPCRDGVETEVEGYINFFMNGQWALKQYRFDRKATAPFKFPSGSAAAVDMVGGRSQVKGKQRKGPWT